MALQNIGIGNRDDAFYRYKMPRLVTKIEGRGNGIKTNLVNMVDVAKALARPPAYITKFYGCELGAQSKFDEKTNTAIVNGSHETAKLSALLENFIKKYVQCYGCGNPETEVIITKGQTITLKCAACGFISNVDMRDKLTTFILKNPPAQKSKKKALRKAEDERLKAGDTVDAEMKRVRRESKKKGHADLKQVSKKKSSSSDEEGLSSNSSQSDEVDPVTEKEEEVEWQTDTSAKAAQQRIKEQLSSATSEMVMLSTVSENKENIKVEKENQGAELKTTHTNLACPFGKLFKDFKLCIDNEYSADQLASHLKFKRPDTSQQDLMNAFFEALFNGVHKGLAKEISRKKLFLTKAITDEHYQALLLGAIEFHYSFKSREMCKEVAVALKMLYDLDILEEDLIVAWYHKCARKELTELAKPFIDWVQNAESEEE
ncbi:hypothetical protein L7F22_041703 [Adiantum nelumboides]|nr:hypothetical protein [Adiantum nelumboides]